MIITRKIFRYKGKLYRIRVYKHRDYDSCSGCIFLMENDKCSLNLDIMNCEDLIDGLNSYNTIIIPYNKKR